MKVNEKIVSKMIKQYGTGKITTICMEECAELIQAVSKEKRKKRKKHHKNVDKEHLAEEMADVLISFEIIKQVYGITDKDIKKQLEIKQKRNKARLK